MLHSTATLALIFSVLAGEPEEIELFDGRSLNGWVAEGVSEFSKDGQTLPVWSVRERKLVCTGKGFGFLRYDLRQFADFVLHAEFRMDPGCNSGVGIRTRAFDPARSRATRPSFFSYEIQLFDDAGKPATTHSSGSLYRYVAPRRNAMRRAGEWNDLEATCIGPRIKLTLNNEQIVDLDHRSRVSRGSSNRGRSSSSRAQSSLAPAGGLPWRTRRRAAPGVWTASGR